MKKRRCKPVLYSIALLLISLSYACDVTTNNSIDDTSYQALTETDKMALLFMLEEEKLARDSYTYLNNLWSVNQFANIQNSEQSHMDAIENLLKQYKVEYTILPFGKFKDDTLQSLYNTFTTQGNLDIISALTIGATIEDIDIVDLQNYMDSTSNKAILNVFEKLQCGSRNHLISYVLGIENNSGSYAPQYLAIETYNDIISGSRKPCN